MKIRMQVQMSGTRNGQPWPRLGEVAELPTTEAAHLVAAGIAEQVDEVETAAAPEAEVSRPPAAKTPPPRRPGRSAKNRE